MFKLPILAHACALLVCLMSSPLSAQTPTSGPSEAAPPAAGSAQNEGDRPDLRARTRGFEPSRFNLSIDGGQGLIRAISPHVLGKWEVGAAASVLNFDRNPGDVDFFEYGWQLAVGLPGRVELFFRGAPVLRTNSVNQEPVGFPVPPLDLIVDTYPTNASREQPYFLYAQEVPFKSYYVYGVRRIEPPGHGAFATSSGDYAFGGKVNLWSEERGDGLTFGLRGFVEVPSENPNYNAPEWRRLAGVSGETDIGLDVLAAKRMRWGDLLMNVGYKHVGDPDLGLRVQLVDSSRWNEVGADGRPVSIRVGAPTEVKLDLHDQLLSTIGTSFPLVNVNGLQFWALSEFSYMRYIGGATGVERLVHPYEMRLGIQANVPKFPSLSIGAAWQLLFNDAGDGGTRRSSFVTPDGRGDINFGVNVDAELSAEFERLFAERGVALGPNTSRIFSTNNPLFDGARNVSTGDTAVVGMGGGNVLAFITWRIR